jgi:hypothetical protein
LRRTSSGPVSALEAFDLASKEIVNGGRRWLYAQNKRRLAVQESSEIAVRQGENRNSHKFVNSNRARRLVLRRGLNKHAELAWLENRVELFDREDLIEFDRLRHSLELDVGRLAFLLEAD